MPPPVALSNAWYPETRTVSDNAQKLLIPVATDAFSQVLKEFWPDVSGISRRRRRRGDGFSPLGFQRPACWIVMNQDRRRKTAAGRCARVGGELGPGEWIEPPIPAPDP